MEWFIAISALGILVFGSWVALWWWRLAQRIAPYKDELERDQARAAAERDRDQSSVIIVPPLDAPRRDRP
jgi:hypothetical protein